MTPQLTLPVVFLGPTLQVAEARALLDAVYLPPASQGDVLRVVSERPRAIAIIDGYFERVPAVWHKEILFALQEGIPVYGAASMGALRAAETAAYGMIGHGRIFEAFRSGQLEDDDEVAVAHASAEFGYRTASVALVNIRATLETATSDGLISPDESARLVAHVKALYYPERTYPRVLEAAARLGMSEMRQQALARHVAEKPRDQKRDDAAGLLARLAREEEGVPATRPWTLMHTAHFASLLRWAEAEGPLLDGRVRTSPARDKSLDGADRLVRDGRERSSG